MAFWSDVYPNNTTIASPTTSDTMTTIASGLASRLRFNAVIAAAQGAVNIGCEKTVRGFEKAVTLLDAPPSAQPFLDLFFRRGALVRQNLLCFLFQHVDDEFVDRFVSR